MPGQSCPRCGLNIAGELSDTPSDCHLKAAFMAYVDAADLNLSKALL